MIDYSSYNDATLNHVLEGHKKELLLAEQEINSINEELLKRRAGQQAKLEFAELAACIRRFAELAACIPRLDDQPGLRDCLPTILAALDSAASRAPQRVK